MYEGLQWNLSNTDTLGTKKSVLFSEVSYVQGETINTYFHVLIKESVFILKLSKRSFTVFHCVEN